MQDKVLRLCSVAVVGILMGQVSFSDDPASPITSALPVEGAAKLPSSGKTPVQALSEQVSQLHSVVDTLVQQQSQSQNELSLLQQRVLQLEAQNELARSKVARETQDNSILPSSSSPADTVQPAPDSAENAALYAKAYTWINQGEYKKAEATLQAYLLAEPKGQYAADSHYWLGEINMVNAQSDVAAKEFRMVIDAFPSSDKAPASMRELGEIFLANGDSQHAKQMLQKVVKEYPDTAAAVLAQKTLDTM